MVSDQPVLADHHPIAAPLRPQRLGGERVRRDLRADADDRREHLGQVEIQLGRIGPRDRRDVVVIVVRDHVVAFGERIARGSTRARARSIVDLALWHGWP